MKQSTARSKSTRARRAPRKQLTQPYAFFDKDAAIMRPLPVDNQVVRQIKQVAGSNFTTSTTVETFRGHRFTFSDLQDATELSSVFDQYRIDRVDWKMVPSATESLASTPLNGRILVAYDFDDGNAPTSSTDLADYTNCIVAGPTEVLQGTFVPRFAYGAYSGVFTSFANHKPDWIDAASPGVEHYGLKIAATTTTSAVTYNIMFRYHVSMRMSH